MRRSASFLGLLVVIVGCEVDVRDEPPANPNPLPSVVGQGPAGSGGAGTGGATTASSTTTGMGGNDGGGGNGSGGAPAGAPLYGFCGCIDSAQNVPSCAACLGDPVMNGCDFEFTACSGSPCAGLVDDLTQQPLGCPMVDQLCMDTMVFGIPPGAVGDAADYLSCACAACIDCIPDFCQ